VRVEVDFSDLEEMAYYIDERSKDLEVMLKNDSGFSECRVKRQHWGGDGEYDTFVIQDKEGNDLHSLDIWEVEALNDSELLSIINANIQREPLEYSGSTFLLIVLSIFTTPFATVFPIMALINPSNPKNPITITIGFLAFLILFLYVSMYFKRRGMMISEKRRIDLTAAQENSTFLAALQKLASEIYKDKWKYEEYRKRLEFVEDVLSGVGR
jgi:hypothetical protein